MLGFLNPNTPQPIYVIANPSMGHELDIRSIAMDVQERYKGAEVHVVKEHIGGQQFLAVLQTGLCHVILRAMAASLFRSRIQELTMDREQTRNAVAFERAAESVSNTLEAQEEGGSRNVLNGSWF